MVYPAAGWSRRARSRLVLLHDSDSPQFHARGPTRCLWSSAVPAANRDCKPRTVPRASRPAVPTVPIGSRSPGRMKPLRPPRRLRRPGRRHPRKRPKTPSAPATVSQLPPSAGMRQMTPRRVFAGEILNLTWETLRTQLGQCLLLGLVIVATYFAGYVISLVLGGLTNLLSALGANAEVQMVATVGLALVQFVWGQVYGAFLAAVAVRYALNVLRGSAEPIQGVFDVLPLLLRVILVQLIISLLAAVVVGVAAMLMVFPLALVGFAGQNARLMPVLFLAVLAPLGLLGWILVWVRFSVALPLVLDRNLGVMEALSESLHYTRGNAAAILWATVAVSILSGMFTLVTCGLGLVLSMPAWVLFRGVVYLRVTGQLDGSQGPLPASRGGNPFASDTGASRFTVDDRDAGPGEAPISRESPFQ